MKRLLACIAIVFFSLLTGCSELDYAELETSIQNYEDPNKSDEVLFDIGGNRIDFFCKK